jgi:hypothetical protein
MRHADKRSVEDRRREYTTISFPFRGSDNTIVIKDRRVRCERRISSIEVAELNISRKDFMSMLNSRYANTKFSPLNALQIKDIGIFDDAIIKD